MDPSESENDDFQSADEFVSDEEPEISVKSDDSLLKFSPIVDPCVGPVGEESDNDCPKAEESYRKRPERKRVVDEVKPKTKRPDTILSDLTGHLTSEFSKGFATLTTTSSSLGSKMGNLVKDIVNVKNVEEVEFEYDDDRTVEEKEPEPVRSAINEEIMKLSDAFVKLNEARAKEVEVDEEVDSQLKVNKNVEVIETKAEELSNDSWDGWEIDDVEINKEIKVEKAVEEKEKVSDGWDDWGEEDETTKKQEEEEDDDDGWENWGDDNEVIEPKPNPPKRELGRHTAPPPKEWSGWDSFGQKKENTWGAGWGINSLLSTATAVTTNISQGLSTVIESGLGVPDPETMARIQKEESKNLPENQLKQAEPELFPLRHLVAGVGKIVEVAKVQEIGSRVLSGGLDTLETIGKKTMQVLQEGDPGLKKKRALIIGQGQMLSQVLKDARDRAMAEDQKSGQITMRRQFETIFDDFQGLVHLEALEMLSKQCEIQLETIQQSLPSHKIQELLDTLEEVNQLCEIDDDFDDVEISDFRQDIRNVAAPLQNELSVDKILLVHERLYDWLAAKVGKDTALDQIYDEAISTIAELTAAITMQFHKSGELLLLKERRKTVEEADCLLQLSSHLCAELKVITEKCVELFKSEENSDLLVSNLRIESENAISYVKQAFRLLVPVLQLGATL